MQNVVIATPVISDAATLTSSSSPATLPVSNLQTMSPKQVWRALAPTAAYIEIDLASSKELNLIALLAHNGSSRTSIRVRASDIYANVTAAPSYDSGLLPGRSHQSGYDAGWAAGVTDEEYGALDKNHFLLWFGAATKTYRYWRIDINDANSVGYFDAGRLYMAKAWQPATNISYGGAEGLIDPSRKQRTVSAQVNVVEREPYRYADFQMDFGSEAEMYDNGFELDRLRGRSRDVLYINDPSATSHLQRRTIYGLMESLQPIVNTNFAIFSKSYRIEELTP